MMHNALQETLFFYKFFLKTHQQNLNFSPYYRGVFFCCGEIKCKQGVKNFAKHPNKTGIFLRIVEGVFSEWCFSFWFSLSKIFSRIILKEVFVCVKIAAVSFFFYRTEFLMNGYHPTSSLFILFSFVQRTRQDKVFGRCL